PGVRWRPVASSLRRWAAAHSRFRRLPAANCRPFRFDHESRDMAGESSALPALVGGICGCLRRLGPAEFAAFFRLVRDDTSQPTTAKPTAQGALMEHYKLLIGGELVDAAGGARGESIDPGSGEVVATFARAGTAEAEQAIDAAARAFNSGAWSGLDPVE